LGFSRSRMIPYTSNFTALAPSAPPPGGRSPTATAGAMPALLIDAREAARLCGVCRAHWLRMQSAGRVPAPVRLGRRTLWRAAELAAWTEANCPGRDVWETLKEARRGR
jgi:predicted DNA-binding transcriptional regulator AlpA